MNNNSYTEPRLSQKRKVSSSPDRIDIDSEEDDYSQQPQQVRRNIATPCKPKRARVVNGNHGLPISRLIETLDRKGLQSLIESACQANPAVASEISSMAPRITVSSAIEILKSHLETIYSQMPYAAGRGQSDSRSDYVYLRVKSYIDEFLSAFADYTTHFLPPNESQPSNTLAFLDSATHLLHNLPTWTSGINNHQKNMAYEELNSAWILATKEASKKANGLGLAHGGWEHKLAKHNEESENRLKHAVNYMNQELSWLNYNNYDAFNTRQSLSSATVWE